jgi:hypothetical protein
VPEVNCIGRLISHHILSIAGTCPTRSQGRHISTVGLLATFAIFLAASTSLAGPVDFGKAELRRALAARHRSLDAVSIELRRGAAETWSLSARGVVGGDERGLMYGLLEAAEQIRRSGKLSPGSGRPVTPLRGIRWFIHNQELEERWYFSREYWDEYFAMLARNRFNRFNLVFAHQTNYLAPPYPYWVALPEFPEIRVPDLTEERRARNLEMLRYISNAAAEHGIDLTLGIWQQDLQTYQTPRVEGLTAENIGPYSRAALRKVLDACPAIRAIQVRTNIESGIPVDRQLEFYRDYIFPAIKGAGRTLDLRAWAVAGGVIDAARQLGVTTRVSTKYWAEYLGRPYQPAETYPGYSYLNLLEKPRSYAFFWEVWTLGSHRILLWGDPDFVKRAVPTFRLSGSIGFEIDAPPTQKGFGNRPGLWDVFTEPQRNRVFWKWDFERYWMFYLLWGRLSYDPDAGDALWTSEMERRFRAAAADVLDAYSQASRVLSEIVAAHLADPNMYIWPEINPGGLIDSYEEVLPSDWRYIASIAETVRNLHSGAASAKQTPAATADLLEDIARRIEAAVERASAKIPETNREWRGTYPDFKVLASLARYHAHKQRAALNLKWFDTTADRPALERAKANLTSGLHEWESLVRFTDGLYSDKMVNGPDDVGHWRDKQPYVRHDLELVREREELLDRFGRFDFGFDFGGPDPEEGSAPGASFRNSAYVRLNNVEPRFRPVSPELMYDEKRGYGWERDGRRREAAALALTPYLEVRGVARDPHSLPHDVLFRDYLRGEGDQVFLVKAPAARYEVIFLDPNRSSRTEMIESTDGLLRIRFPAGDWAVSGLIVKGPHSRFEPAALHLRPELPRPPIVHEPPRLAAAGKPLTLAIDVQGKVATRIRLHYRALNQNDSFHTLEGSSPFVIPGEDISERWDLMYYFEILNAEGSGWFYPDPATATPYFVLPTQR